VAMTRPTLIAAAAAAAVELRHRFFIETPAANAESRLIVHHAQKDVLVGDVTSGHISPRLVVRRLTDGTLTAGCESDRGIGYE